MTSTRKLLLGDTSFISAWAGITEQSNASIRWPLGLERQLGTATVAISVVTVAEVRFGHWQAQWGERRRNEAERFLRRFIQLPVDQSAAEAWAWIKAGGRRCGCTFGANDLWIAATGFVRDAPIVTCDRDFLPMRELGVQVIYLPRAATARRAGSR